MLCVPTENLDATVQDAACVRDVVGSAQDVSVSEHGPVSLFEKLVVGCTGDDLHFQFGNRLIVDHAAESARSEDIRTNAEDVIRLDHLGNKLINDTRHVVANNISDDEFSA